MNIRAEVTKLLLRRIAPQVDVRVILPNGQELGPDKPNLPTLRILNDDFFIRLGNDLKIGLGESFMAKDWVAEPDLAEVLTPYAEKLLNIVPGWMRKFRKFFEPFQPKIGRAHV